MITTALIAVWLSGLLRLRESTARPPSAPNAPSESPRRRLRSDLYNIIADAEVNHDLPKTERVWTASKHRTLGRLARLEAIAETPDDRALVTAARTHADALIALFENEMVPVLRSKAGATALGAEDATAAGEAQAMSVPLKQLTERLQSRNARTNAEFDRTADATMATTFVLSLGDASSPFGLVALLVVSLKRR